jgi:transposase
LIRGLMTDDEWAYFEPFLIHRGGGRPPRNHRRVLDAVFWLMRTGAPWRDLPEGFGNWNSIFRQFRRWADSGVWDVILEGLAGSGVSDAALQMIDATIIRAHHCAAGGNVWPAPSASGFCSWPKTVCTNVSGLSAMPLTKMEIRAFCSS